MSQVFSQIFGPKHGMGLYLYLVGALIFSVAILIILQILPQTARKHIIRVVTFLGGLYYAVEFFWPVHALPDGSKGNFLTPFIVPIGNFIVVVGNWAVGLGLFNLFQIHGKRILKGNSDSINSLVFFLGTIVMMLTTILNKAHPNAINKNLYELFFNGGLQAMDATMFSIIAFYIVSAAYRAFRIRSVEATLLLTTAILVMLGQISIGYMMTSWIKPTWFFGLGHDFHTEVIREWILNKANVPAVRAITFGLDIGALAFALRIWLGLERSGYFENQG